MATTSTSSGDEIKVEPASEAGRLAQESAAEFRAADATPNPSDKAHRLRVAQSLAGESALAAAYSHLQKAVVLFGGEFQGSISAYYHTHTADYFVGSLFALAVFFLSYNYRPLPKYKVDNVLSTFASVAALGVAFFPTANDAVTASGGE